MPQNNWVPCTLTILAASLLGPLQAQAQEKKPDVPTVQTPADLSRRIEQAIADRDAWHERAAWSSRMHRLGYVSKSQADTDQAKLKSAEQTLNNLLESRQTEGQRKDIELARVPRELLHKRVESALLVYKLKTEKLRAGAGAVSVTDLAQWSRRLMDAQLALDTVAENPNAEERIKIHHDHLVRAQQVEALAQAFHKAGQAEPAETAAATYHRIEAEILLVQAGGKLP